ncbi:response regulator [Shewanella sp. VB17]|uniref:response regulator n=1 Tax=Shewanella sp. VB17 TaxID=2739432 RepID=UPI0015661284|nr:response regulator [Shewanella sp. VB17]NRD75114.1 response regulator [Shewanella sp. VB17]
MDKNKLHSLLIIEDDKKLASLLTIFFEKYEFNVTVEYKGDKGLTHALTSQPDFILLDLMLPVMDGFSICRALQNRFNGIILVLTASDEEMDHVSLLEMGAHDFIQKPINPRIILARMRNLIRLTTAVSASEEAASPKTNIQHGKLKLNPTLRCAYLDQQSVTLTDSEFDVLWLLASRADSIVSRDELYQTVLGREFDGLDRAIDNKIVGLRKKVDDNVGPHQRIITVRGKGYLFVPYGWE